MGSCRFTRRPVSRSPGAGTFRSGATAAPGQDPGGARPKGLRFFGSAMAPHQFFPHMRTSALPGPSADRKKRSA
eukprot:5241517-Alexandrium_andersonii.AAC.1